jgi:acetyl esterase/lipase
MSTLSRYIAPFSVALFLLSFAAAVHAADPVLTLNVWPALPPGDKPDMGKEILNEKTNTITGVVATPTLAVYRPAKDKDTGAAILICPGGGFYQLSMGHEGSDVAAFFNAMGVTGVVLKYRIPNREGMPRYMAGLQDAQRSMSIIRAHAAEWGIDPHRLGILGFSAGGQLAADVESNFTKRMYEAMDDIDKQDTRPDYAFLIYPGGIAARGGEAPALSADVKISKDCPPTFLSISSDDRGGPENAIYTYLLLKRAGVPAELHVWGEGGHGYGIRPSTAPHGDWPERAAAWMTQRGYLKNGPTTRASGN